MAETSGTGAKGSDPGPAAMIATVDASVLRRVVEVYGTALHEHRDALNRLNVYPVPDGDTGTNMALTLESVVAELGDHREMRDVCRAIGHGSLMGARGNSGVILSQILRGLASTFERGDDVDCDALAAGLQAAADAAYTAVMRPVEGTILTVARAAGEAAVGYGGSSTHEMLDAARSSAAAALSRTPELLPVLAQAGVVDAGGAGYLLFLDAFLHVLAGRPIPAPPVPAAGSPRLRDVGSTGEPEAGGVSELRYEVMFFLEAADDSIDGFKDVWMSVGDSIVVVGGDGLYNCHIHTDDIGAAIEAALDCGRPKKIRVTDLTEQVEEERWVRDAAAHGEEQVGLPDADAVRCAVVAVGTGAGIRRIFRSLGVQAVVAGGQSMNPSTAQILEAVEAAPGQHVVVLPNNKNIIPVAEQVQQLTSKVVRVVRTTSVAEGFGALLEYDPEGDADTNLAAMSEAASRIVSGEVTRAVRSSTSDVGPIAEGDYLGISRNGIDSVDPSLVGAATGLLEVLVGDDHEIVTVIEGEGSTPAETRRITDWLAEHRPAVSVEVHAGGQPLYPYLFSVE